MSVKGRDVLNYYKVRKKEGGGGRPEVILHKNLGKFFGIAASAIQ
jgi:hypothetical protein